MGAEEMGVSNNLIFNIHLLVTVVLVPCSQAQHSLMYLLFSHYWPSSAHYLFKDCQQLPLELLLKIQFLIFTGTPPSRNIACRFVLEKGFLQVGVGRKSRKVVTEPVVEPLHQLDFQTKHF